MESRNKEKNIREINEFILSIRGPICYICGHQNAKYDMKICEMCQDAIDRLKPKQ